MPAATAEWEFDWQDDFLVADGIETVTFTPQLPDGTYDDPQDGRGFWESPSNSTVALVGAVDRTWNLFADDLVSTQINPGDKLTDHTGAEWVVQRATLDGIGDQWRLDTAKAVVSEPAG